MRSLYVHECITVLEHMEDEVIQDALRAGVDLRSYSKQIEQQLRESEQAAIDDYIAEAEQIAGLHREITQCNNVLEV